MRIIERHIVSFLCTDEMSCYVLYGQGAMHKDFMCNVFMDLFYQHQFLISFKRVLTST